MLVRDRILALRRVPAARLRPHPSAWQVHPTRQREVLAALLGEVGFATALVVRELDDGSYEILDGQLRAELTSDQEVPVIVLDVNDADALKLVAAFDPVGGLAEPDPERLAALAAAIEWDHPLLAELIAVTLQAALPPENSAEAWDDTPFEPTYQIVIDCESETEQQALFERLEREGYQCRVVTL